jgi:formylglycine-generating enzyme required for sulfatase activity
VALFVVGSAGHAAAESATAQEVSIPAGEFIYGDSQGEEDERPSRRLSLPAFQIDRTEVTVAAYGVCVAARACRAAAGPAKDGRLPVAGVSYLDAAAYCSFVGKRLPTEFEWEKAARGVDGRPYPWGAELACERGNFGNFAGDGRCAEDGAAGRPVPVGSFPQGASPYGVLDLAGNVAEWVDGRAGTVAARTVGIPEPELRVLRGSGCCSILGLPRASNRMVLPASYRDVDIGFRCARSLTAPGSASRRATVGATTSPVDPGAASSRASRP